MPSLAVHVRSLTASQGLDPAVHSISYLFVLDVLVEYVVCGLPVDREWVLDRVMHFMIRFDRDQSQYAGPAMLTLLERIGGGQLFPVSWQHVAAVEALELTVSPATGRCRIAFHCDSPHGSKRILFHFYASPSSQACIFLQRHRTSASGTKHRHSLLSEPAEPEGPHTA